MRKKVFGRHLKRDTHERKALFKGLASSVIEYERIETTEEKAKAVKGYVEKLVTKAKKHDGAKALALLQPFLTQRAVIKMIEDVAPRFTNRKGGYLRIIKSRQRFNDNANMVFMEWVEKSVQNKALSTTAKETAPAKKNEAVKPKDMKLKKEVVKSVEKKPKTAAVKKTQTKKKTVKEKKK